MLTLINMGKQKVELTLIISNIIDKLYFWNVFGVFS